MERDWATAELALRRGIERKPSNAYARAMLGDMLRNQGRVKEAIEQQRAALRLDPLSPVIHGVLAISLTAAGKYEEALLLWERNLAEGGDDAAARQFLLLSGPLYGLTGAEMAEHATELARIMGARDPESAQVLGYAFAAAAGGTGSMDGRLISHARKAAEALIADSVFNARQSAVIYTRLGDIEVALRWLEQAAAANDLSLGMTSTDPSLDPLRDDPRMQRLMEELHLPNGYDVSMDVYEPEGGK
ncbi:MAG: tetratricopeptide repeat protein [Gemmatimonadota bacterium]